MGMGMNVRQLCTGNQERRVKWNHDINQDTSRQTVLVGSVQHKSPRGDE